MGSFRGKLARLFKLQENASATGYQLAADMNRLRLATESSRYDHFFLRTGRRGSFRRGKSRQRMSALRPLVFNRAVSLVFSRVTSSATGKNQLTAGTIS